ncbi:uncharacterized protein LOC118464832 [Anopheles albimanus]|uniref:Uncharacterized protein n=1 Tax=Anopheles albimanus TaxID=7167 RepID=A0A182FDW7_ANOAL|nr:uncharacterized protein LOC118464832 [Anopheles albimanus]
MSETVVLAKTATVMPTRPRSAPLERRSGLEPTAVSNANTGSNCEPAARDLKQQQQQPQRALMKDLVRDNSKLVKDLMALLAIREATKEEQAPARLEELLPATVAAVAATDGRKKDSKCLLLPGIKGVKNRPSSGDGGSGPPAALIPFTGSATRSTASTAAAAVASLLHHTATKEFSSLAGEMIAIADDTNTGSLASSDNDDDVDNEDPPDVGADRDERKCTKDDGKAGHDCTELHAAANAPEPNAHNETDDGRSDPNPQQQDHHHQEQRYGKGKPESEVESVVHRRQSQSEPAPADGQETHLARVSVGGIERGGTPPVPPVAPVLLPVTEQTGGRVAQLTLEQKLDRLLDGVVKIKADMLGRIERLGRRVEQVHLDVKLNIDTTDRALLKNVLLLIGIPRLEREDLRHYFRSICLVLDYQEQDIPEVDIRRQQQQRRGSGRSGGGKETSLQVNGEHCPPARAAAPPQPIMVEFKFKTMRDQFYRAYQAKRILRLSDIGIVSDRRFYVNEALTKYNRMLMGEAMRRKRAGLLHSVYTADGIVYVQRVAGEKGTKVTSFAALD